MCEGDGVVFPLRREAYLVQTLRVGGGEVEEESASGKKRMKERRQSESSRLAVCVVVCLACYVGSRKGAPYGPCSGT